MFLQAHEDGATLAFGAQGDAGSFSVHGGRGKPRKKFAHSSNTTSSDFYLGSHHGPPEGVPPPWEGAMPPWVPPTPPTAPVPTNTPPLPACIARGVPLTGDTLSAALKMRCMLTTHA